MKRSRRKPKPQPFLEKLRNVTSRLGLSIFLNIAEFKTTKHHLRSTFSCIPLTVYLFS